MRGFHHGLDVVPRDFALDLFRGQEIGQEFDVALRPGDGGIIQTAHPPLPGFREIPDSGFTIFRHLSDGEFALAFINLSEAEATLRCELVDLGLPVFSGFALEAKDVFTGENLGRKADYFNQTIPGHDMRLFLCRLVKARG